MSAGEQGGHQGTPTTPIYVAIDLETTGLQVETDEIIEVAAVKFAGSNVLETWQTLVCPSRDVPYRIHRLTGIRRAELDSAPQFSAIAGKLRGFIKNYPLVGHSVSFDASFLQRQGLALTNVTLDTFAFAMILLPTLSSYTLENVAIALGIGTVTHHRAMVDSVLAKNVFLSLTAKLDTLDLAALEEVEMILARVRHPLADLFRQAVQRKRLQTPVFSSQAGNGVSIANQLAAKMGVDQTIFSLPVASTMPPVLTPPVRSSGKGTPPALTGAMAPGGPELTSESAQALWQGLVQNFPLYGEIGPEANSYLAVLAVILNWALDTQKRVVIAAGSPVLRQDLLAGDLPAFQQMQIRVGRTFSFSSLDVPTSYICLHRWFAPFSVLRSAAPSLLESADPVPVSKFSLWLRQTTTGNRSELSMMPQEGPTWEQIRAGETLPAPPTCAYLKHGYCFVQRALEEAQQAQVLVVSHQLLLHSGAVQQATLAGYDRVVVLEAHQLEEEATRLSSSELSAEQLTTLIARFSDRSLKEKEIGSGHSPGATPGLAGPALWLLAPLQRLPHTFPAQVQRDLLGYIKGISEAAEATQNGIGDLFQALKALLVQQLEQGRRPGSRVQLETSDQPVRFTMALRYSAIWTSVSECWIHLERQALWLDREIKALLEFLNHEPLAQHSPTILASEISMLYEQVQQLYTHLRQTIAHPLPDRVYWLRAAPQTSNVVLYSAPLLPLVQLQSQLKQQQLTPIFLSSLFTVDGRFDYVRERLGGSEESGSELVLTPRKSKIDSMPGGLAPTLINTLHQIPLFVPEDIPEPNRPANQDHLEQTILRLSMALHGRVVVLFTAHAALRSIYSAIKPTMEARDILVLGQVVDGSPRQLWQSFRSTPRVVLLGTGNLWDNLDVHAGTSLCLVITRLPFVPSRDPIYAARAERYSNAMQHYTIPQMALRLKHMVIRLVAAPIWPGCIVCLDHRLTSKDYAQALLHSLPVSQIITAPTSIMIEQVSQWFKQR